MTQPVKIALNLIGFVLVVGGAITIILLIGLAALMFAQAWTGSFADILLMILISLYALPVAGAMLFGGTLAVSSASNEPYFVPTIRSQRTVGIMLLFPSMATVVLTLGYPDFSFWPPSMIGLLPILLALVLAGLGTYLLVRTRGLENARAGQG